MQSETASVTLALQNDRPSSQDREVLQDRAVTER